jgi:hypothetical protein
LKQKNRGAQKLGPGNSVIGTSERKRISRPALRPGNLTLAALRHFVSPDPDLESAVYQIFIWSLSASFESYRLLQSALSLRRSLEPPPPLPRFMPAIVQFTL